jgi:hypothetical protein
VKKPEDQVVRKSPEEIRAEILLARQQAFERKIRAKEERKAARECWDRLGMSEQQEIFEWAKSRYPWLLHDQPHLFETLCIELARSPRPGPRIYREKI